MIRVKISFDGGHTTFNTDAPFEIVCESLEEAFEDRKKRMYIIDSKEMRSFVNLDNVSIIEVTKE